MSTKKERGFTLIELLVVIAIIGILSSVVLASLNTARKKGRDARRISDMKQLQLALELYYDSSNTYPVVSSLTTLASGTAPGDVISPTYISTVPVDPTNSGSYVYRYQSIGSDGTSACTSGSCPSYVLTTTIEGVGAVPAGGVQGSVGGATCSGQTYCVMP